ncbi:MAG: MFS transporter [Rhodospirillales bacterium]|nr:MFS transporter [Rhodospirillales bacterium]
MQDLQKSRWDIIALAIAAGIFGSMFIGKAPPSVPVLRAELDLSLVQAGWVVSIFSAVGMSSGMVAGLFADRLGHRRLLIIGLLVLVTGGVLGSAVNGSVLMLMTRFIEGFGYIAVAVAAPSLILSSASPNDRRLALGMWGVYVPAGIAAAMLFSPLVLESYGWRTLWLVVSGLAAMLLTAIVLVKPSGMTAPDSSPRQHSPFYHIRLTLTRPGPPVLALCFAVYALQWTSVMVWLPSFLIEQKSISLSGSAALTALVVAVNVPGNMLGGWLLHRRAQRWILLAVTNAIVGLTVIGIFSEALSDTARYALCLAFSGIGGIVPATLFSAGSVHAPSMRQLGLTNGLLMQGSHTGNFIGPPVIAAVVASTGLWQGTFWILFACSVAGVLLGAVIGVIEKYGARNEGVTG